MTPIGPPNWGGKILTKCIRLILFPNKGTPMGTTNQGELCFNKGHLKGTSYSLTNGQPKDKPNWGGIYFFLN
jgi:hypothetical protein